MILQLIVGVILLFAFASMVAAPEVDRIPLHRPPRAHPASRALSIRRVQWGVLLLGWSAGALITAMACMIWISRHS